MVNRTGPISAVIKPTLEFSYKLMFGAKGVLIEFLWKAIKRTMDSAQGVFIWEELLQQASHASEKSRYKCRELKIVAPGFWGRDFIAKNY